LESQPEDAEAEEQSGLNHWTSKHIDRHTYLEDRERRSRMVVEGKEE
jgi:hypothetical protein